MCWRKDPDPWTAIDLANPVAGTLPSRALPAGRVRVTRDALGRSFECELTAGGDVRCASTGSPAVVVQSNASAIWGGARLCVHARDGWLGCSRHQPGSLDRLTIERVARFPVGIRVHVGVELACVELPESKVECWHWQQTWRPPSGEADYALVRETLRPPVAIAVEKPRALSVGAHHACALSGDGRVVCWGRVARELPTARMELPELAGATAIRAGRTQACAVQDGRAFCWGGDVERPRAIEGLAGVKDVAPGDRHACALTERGEVHCWPIGEAPARVSGLTAVTELRSGPALTCALARLAEVKCWEVGAAPRAIRSLKGARNISVDGSTVCATRGSGVVCHQRDRSDTVLEGEPVSALSGRCALLASGQIACFDWWLEPGLDRPEELRAERIEGVSNVQTLHALGTSGCGRTESGAPRCFEARIAPVVDDSPRKRRALESEMSLGEIAIGGGFECALRPQAAPTCWGNIVPAGGVRFETAPLAATLPRP